MKGVGRIETGGDSSVRNFEGCLIASKLVTRLRSRDAQLESCVINGTFKKGRTYLDPFYEPKKPASVMRFPGDLDRPSVIR